MKNLNVQKPKVLSKDWRLERWRGSVNTAPWLYIRGNDECLWVQKTFVNYSGHAPCVYPLSTWHHYTFKLTGMTDPPVSNQWQTNCKCKCILRLTRSLLLPTQAYNSSGKTGLVHRIHELECRKHSLWNMRANTDVRMQSKVHMHNVYP